MKNAYIKLLTVLIVVVLVSSCGTYQYYEGDPRPKNEVATINVKQKLEWHQSKATCYLTNFKDRHGRNFAEYSAVDLLPGTYFGRFFYKRSDSNAPRVMLEFTVEAGNLYKCVVETHSEKRRPEEVLNEWRGMHSGKKPYAQVSDWTSFWRPTLVRIGSNENPVEAY